MYKKSAFQLFVCTCTFFFISFWIIEHILVTFKIEYSLSWCWGGGGGKEGTYMYAALQTTLLYMTRLNKTEFPIFVLLSVLCFKGNL